jgi:hypothetical protein
LECGGSTPLWPLAILSLKHHFGGVIQRNPKVSVETLTDRTKAMKKGKAKAASSHRTP